MVSIVEAIEENYCAIIELFGIMPGTQFTHEPDLTRYVTGCRMSAMNGVLRSRIDPDADFVRALSLIQDFRIRDIPALWRLGETSSHRERCASFLTASGCQQVTNDPEMVLEAANAPRFDCPDLRIEEASDAAGISDWIDLFISTFGGEADDIAFYKRFLIKTLDLPGNPIRHFVGYLDGAPICGASLFTHGDLPMLYNVSTSPDFRRRGYGRGIVCHCIRDAVARGASHVALLSTDAGFEMYSRLGFKAVGRLDAYYI